MHDTSWYTSQNETEAVTYFEDTVDFEKNLRTQIENLEELIIESDANVVDIEVDTHVIAQEEHFVDESRPLNNLSAKKWWQNFSFLEDDSNKDVQVARMLLLAAAALYGTNFALVKILDENVPVGASTSLRFGLASLVSLPWLFPSAKDLKKTESFFELSEPEVFWGSTIAGMEVGLWTSLGYIAQAVGLETIDASKVSVVNKYFSYTTKGT